MLTLVQVRSLASEAARQALHGPQGWGLQWYAADFQEERSALDGALLVSWWLSMAHRCIGNTTASIRLAGAPPGHHQHLRPRLCPVQEQQTAFAVDCLRWLWVQHAEHATGGTSQRIIVVGHSMGGVVARAAVAHLAAGSKDGVLCNNHSGHQAGSGFVRSTRVKRITIVCRGISSTGTGDSGVAAPAIACTLPAISGTLLPPPQWQGRPVSANGLHCGRYSRCAGATQASSCSTGMKSAHACAFSTSCGNGLQVPRELTSLQQLVPDGWAFEGGTDQMPGIWATADHQVSSSGCKLACIALRSHARFLQAVTLSPGCQGNEHGRLPRFRDRVNIVHRPSCGVISWSSGWQRFC